MDQYAQGVSRCKTMENEKALRHRRMESTSPGEHADGLINAVLVNDQGVSEEDAQRVSNEVIEREYDAAEGSDLSGPTV